MATRLTIYDMCRIARVKGGKCLGKEYVNEYTPLKWMCEKGHTWDADYAVIRQGGWCRQCSKSEEKLHEAKLYAKEKGGYCLSQLYINSKSVLKWKCSSNHTWSKTYNELRRQGWCKQCRIEEERKIKFEKLIRLVKIKGGRCLSSVYINSTSKLIFECSKNHIWNTTPANISEGNWCPYCAGNILLTLDDIQAIARQKGGKCLSSEYVNSITKLKFQCSRGHTWMTVPNIIRQGSWCKRCASIETGQQRKIDISFFKKLAAGKGGKLLSSEYTNCLVPLKWECAKGHVWSAKPYYTRNLNQWCPKCARNMPDISDMQKIAQMRGGKCLSKIYKTSKIPLEWQCSKGHKWKTKSSHILRGTWCAICAREKRFGTKILEER